MNFLLIDDSIIARKISLRAISDRRRNSEDIFYEAEN